MIYLDALERLLAELPLRRQEILLEELTAHPRLTRAVARRALERVRARMVGVVPVRTMTDEGWTARRDQILAAEGWEE